MTLHEDLFCDNQVQDQQSDRDAMNVRVEAQEPSMDDSIFASKANLRRKIQELRNPLRTRRQMEMTQLKMRHWTLVQ